MTKIEKKITRKILEEELGMRANNELKDKMESIIMNELEEIIEEYGIPNMESLKELLDKDGLKINITQRHFAFTLKL